jgi:hypothetical protein
MRQATVRNSYYYKKFNTECLHEFFKIQGGGITFSSKNTCFIKDKLVENEEFYVKIKE